MTEYILGSQKTELEAKLSAGALLGVGVQSQGKESEKKREGGNQGGKANADRPQLCKEVRKESQSVADS